MQTNPLPGCVSITTHGLLHAGSAESLNTRSALPRDSDTRCAGAAGEPEVSADLQAKLAELEAQAHTRLAEQVGRYAEMCVRV